MSTNLGLDVFGESDSAWNEALSRLDGRTFCHQAGWARVIERSFGHESIGLAARDASGAVVGLLPLVRMKSRIFGHNLISMPYLNYGGPVGSPEACKALATAGAELATTSGAGLMELRDRRPTDLGLPVSLGKVTVVLPLPANAETLFNDVLKAKVRSQVRRPMKEGMTSSFGLSKLGEFYDVFCENMRDLGTPVLPRRFFETIADVFPDQMIVGLVYSGAKAVAGGVGFLFEGEFELTWASSLRAYAREAPNMLLYWSLMEEVIRRGGTAFNFGRCTPDSGTHRFKRQWGGVDVQLHWSRWSPSTADSSPVKDRPIFQLATRVWRRLPLPIANALGPLVSPALPSW